MSTISGVRQEPCTSTERPVKQLSSTDSKINNLAKTAFEKIAAFVAYCKSKFAALKEKCLALGARITSFFKKSDSLSEPSQISRPTSLGYGIQAPPSTPAARSRSSSLDNDSLDNAQPAQVSVRESTPQNSQLIPYQPNPFLQAHNAAMQEIYNRSLRSLVDNNYELPSPAENLLNTLHPFTLLTLLPANASQPEIPVATGAPVNPEQVLASAISFAQRQNRPNTSPDANVDQFSQLTQQQKLEISEQLTVNNPHLPAGGQTTQSSGAKAAMMFAAGAGVLAGTAVLKNDPEFLNKLASGATTAAQSAVKIAQPVLARAFEAATNGAQTVADALKSVAANAQFSNG